MSHIVKDNTDLDVLKYFYENLDLNDLSESFFCDVFSELIPRCENGLLVNYNVDKKGYYPAIYFPNNNYVCLGMDSLLVWIRNNSKNIREQYHVSDVESFNKFLAFFAITHEIEHSFQYLMALDKIESPCILVRDGYRGIIDLLKKDDYIIPRPVKRIRKVVSSLLYKINENKCVLERNANIESLDLLCKLSAYLENDESFKVFDDMKNDFLKLGYIDDTCGNMIETYQKILMSDKFSDIDVCDILTFDDRIRYGLKIDEEERKKVLSLGKKYSKNNGNII